MIFISISSPLRRRLLTSSISAARWASNTSTTPTTANPEVVSKLKPAEVIDLLSSIGIIPPKPLYRRILRAHRFRLDPRMRALGDSYVKGEFRIHSKIENPGHILGFLTEWNKYLQQLDDGSWKDGSLDKSRIDKLNDDQIAQLYQLMNETKELKDK